LAQCLGIFPDGLAAGSNWQNVIKDEIIGGVTPDALVTFPFLPLPRREVMTVAALLGWLLPMMVFPAGKGSHPGLSIILPLKFHRHGTAQTRFR